MAIERQVKAMSDLELSNVQKAMIEKVKRIQTMLNEQSMYAVPMFHEEKEALIAKLKRLRAKYAHVETELDNRLVAVKQRVTEIVDLVVGL